MCFTLSQLQAERAAHAAAPCKISLDVFAIIYTHTKKREKKNQNEHLSNVDLKEELEKLTSQAHFSSLALSRNKQFS